MASILSSRRRRYSTLRKLLPFLVWHTYITSASLPCPNTRRNSNRPIKSICDSQHRVLTVALLMWSSPAALVKVQSSVKSLSSGGQSFFCHPSYHLRMVSRLFEFSPVSSRALARVGITSDAASAYGLAASTARRDK